MQVSMIKQCEYEDLREYQPHAILAASGFEERARCIPVELSRYSSGRKVAFAFDDRRTGARDENDKCLGRAGFELVQAGGDSEEIVRKTLSEVINSTSADLVKLIVDYSSMTRLWYAGIISYLRDAQWDNRHVEVVFTYCSATFEEPRDRGPNLHMGPLGAFTSLQIPDTPTILIVGLGYELNAALGLAEVIEAAETFALIANPGVDSRYVKHVRLNNSPLLEDLTPDHQIEYDMADQEKLIAVLASLCGRLRKDSRVVLAPIGPKPFTLASLLVGCRFRDVSVWRVSPGLSGPIYRASPGGMRLALHTLW